MSVRTAYILVVVYECETVSRACNSVHVTHTDIHTHIHIHIHTHPHTSTTTWEDLKTLSETVIQMSKHELANGNKLTNPFYKDMTFCIYIYEMTYAIWGGANGICHLTYMSYDFCIYIRNVICHLGGGANGICHFTYLNVI